MATHDSVMSMFGYVMKFQKHRKIIKLKVSSRVELFKNMFFSPWYIQMLPFLKFLYLGNKHHEDNLNFKVQTFQIMKKNEIIFFELKPPNAA